MASFGKVLDLLDDRYLELQDVIGNVEPLPALVPYEEYTQNVLVYRMDTEHEIFMGLIQDFTMRRAHETQKELWTWLVQWEVDNSTLTPQPPSPKKLRLDVPQANALFKTPLTPRQAPALTIFERRTLDGALMLEEDMLRILIDIVQVASSLVPNFIEFLYRWVDYYEGDGKALKAALRWEIPSLWDFEYHPLVLPQDTGKDGDNQQDDNLHPGRRREEQGRSVSNSNTAELRQSSPTKKTQARPKPDLIAIELRTLHTEENERLQYREVKFGIQPPKLEQPLPPLINIPRDHRKRIKYYAACSKSRQRAIFLLLEAGITMRQINNYQKLQTAHPRETPDTGHGNGLRNYNKDAKYAQTQFEMKEKQVKQREIAISDKLAVEAQFAANHAIPDGAAGLPLIPPTPSYARKPNMAAAMMQKIKETRLKRDGKISIVPGPLVGRLKSKTFEHARKDPTIKGYMVKSGWRTRRNSESDRPSSRGHENMRLADVDGQVEDRSDAEVEDEDEEMENEGDFSSSDGKDDDGEDTARVPAPAPSLPRPSLPRPLPPQPYTIPTASTSHFNNTNLPTGLPAPYFLPGAAIDQFVPPSIATYMQNLSTEQAQQLLPLLNPQARQTAASRFQESSQAAKALVPHTDIQSARQSSSSQLGRATDTYTRPNLSEAPPLGSATTSLGHVCHGVGTARSLEPGRRALPDPPSAANPFITLLRPTALEDYMQQSPPRTVGPSALPTAAFAGPQQYASAHGSPNTSTHSPFLTSTGGPSISLQPASPVPVGFNPDYFMYLRRQQEASQTAIRTNTLQPTQLVLSDTQSASQPQSGTTFDLQPRAPAPGQRMLSANYSATNAHADSIQRATTSAQTLLPQRPQSAKLQDFMQGRQRLDGPQTLRAPVLPSVSPFTLTLQPQSQVRTLTPSPLPVSDAHSIHPSSTNAPTLSPYPPPAGAMLPPPRPGISRSAPKPLSLSSPKPSPYTTFAPQVLATSPFLSLSSNPRPPIQIYFPKILVPRTSLDTNNVEYIRTDALMLGHESPTGALILSKAILLPVGVWENTLRKVRSGRWSVVETYACPPSHPAKGKGKGRMGDAVQTGCHGVVYDKLVQAYGLMNAAPAAREEELTKRWRVSRGPMTRVDRGAVWEGWGVVVDKGVEMGVSERRDALKSEVIPAGQMALGGEDGCGSFDDACEADRRKKEMEELMDEDEEMDG